MTSNPPAEPRPPPSISILSGLPRAQQPRLDTHNQHSSAKVVDKGNVEPDVEIIDSRPVKRRKLSDIQSSAADVVRLASNSQAYSANGSIPQRYTSASWLSIIEAQSDAVAKEQGDGPTQPPPLPERPWGTIRKINTTLDKGRPGCRVRKDVAVPTAPDAMISPVDAPNFEDSRQADYFPWTGKHLEDNLTDTHVKLGYFDRAPNPPERELNTARTPLHGAFKHRPSLDSLSALFGLLLDQKNGHGAFSSLSTFKGPPPRVTLTEAKRKSWITDLANIDVPLKRLSKTIPQGIRGQLLLDQCLSNAVPISRALWFVKCVGANEIRTLRRKGAIPSVANSAEIKWLREWTINVEQFIEQLLSQFSQDDWKEHTQYAVQLATHLYAENLLDRDHYLDWMVKSFVSASMSLWPFWLMVICLYRIDLLVFRKRAKQLAETLVLRWNFATQCQPPDLFEELTAKLRHVIRLCIFLRPSCCLMPDKWAECQKALSGCLDTKIGEEREILQQIQLINDRTMGHKNQKHNEDRAPEEVVIEILDTSRSPFSISDLSEKLLTACDDRDELLRICLRWCISRYRTGLKKVYLTARLFRRWKKHGFDIDHVLFNSISREVNIESWDLASLRHLFSELSRSQTFSISKFLQWMTVRGLPREGTFGVSASIPILWDEQGLPTASIQACNPPLQLLTEICLVGVDVHIYNLRHAMLSRSGFDGDNELEVVQSCKAYLNQKISCFMQRQPGNYSRHDFSHLSWSLRTRLSTWLRSETRRRTQDPNSEIVDGTHLNANEVLTVQGFSVIRDALEQLQDIAILADVLRIAAYTKQEDLLATLVDTINIHSESLSAIGALEALQHLYCQTYLTLRPVKTSMPLLATSLIDLCTQYPVKITPLRALQQDFVRGDRSRAIAACSPFSDGVAESLQQAGATFYDDFEAILQTESNMNEQTMTRLFSVLVDRIMKTHRGEEGDEQISFSLCQLLCRLKLCRRACGETLIKKWLMKLFNPRTGKAEPALLTDLVGTGCVRLETCIEICNTLPLLTDSPWRKCIHDLVYSLANNRIPPESVDERLWYTAKVAYLKLAKNNAIEVFEIIVEMGTDVSGTSQDQMPLISTIIRNNEMGKGLSEPAWLVLSDKLSEVLAQSQTSESSAAQARKLAEIASPLSALFCQFRLRMLCQAVTVKNNEDIQDEIANALYTSMDELHGTSKTSVTSLQSLLQAAGPVITTKVRLLAEQAFYRALPRFLQGKPASSPSLPTDQETSLAKMSLRRAFSISAEDHPTGQATGMVSLIEKLSMYLKYLGTSSATTGVANAHIASAIAAPSPAPTSAPVVMSSDHLRSFLVATLDTLEVLMGMVCIKRAVFSLVPSQPSPMAVKQSQQDQIKLLGLIISIATHPAWSLITGDDTAVAQCNKARLVTDTMLDVAATLVDEMADESRAFCARLLKDKVKDERVRWLLGSVNACGSSQYRDGGYGLQLYHESKGLMGSFKPKAWEMLESGGGGGGGNDSCLGLGLFGARKL